MGTKAFMSDRTARMLVPSYSLGGIERDAEAEARMILAETERHEPAAAWFGGRLTVIATDHAPLAKLAQFPSGAALAEALAAFVADDELPQAPQAQRVEPASLDFFARLAMGFGR